MNSNNHYFYGNQQVYHQATTSSTVAYQAPYDANQVRYEYMNHSQGFYNHNNFYNQGPYLIDPPFNAPQLNCGTTATSPQGQFVDVNGTGNMMPQGIPMLPQPYHHPGNFGYQSQGQTHQGCLPQKQQQPLIQHQAALPAIQAAPQVPPQHQYVHQDHQGQLPVIQSTPQRPVSAPSTSSSIPAPLFNPTLPPFANPSTMASHPPINVELLNKDLWQLFYGLQNEMSVNNGGKELFPHLSYKVSGLNKRGQYKFVLWLERTDSFEFDFDHELKQFKRSNRKDKGNAITNHISSRIRTGHEWENGKVDFGDVNLYNLGKPEKSEKATKCGPKTEKQLQTAQKKANKLGKPRICVSLNCKYIPVMAIYEVTNGVCIHRGDFRFEETSFLAVFNYRNPIVCAHKTALNTSNGKTKRAKAEMKLKEYNGEATRLDSGYSIASDATPPPSSQFLGPYVANHI